mmetsp:Transcript_98395/g.212161  ORF Transcript_98395/g.212161 Transcript_98395/m.212161 type:complete len:468 (-) Transcript_98395:140-1543(-)
MDAAVAFTVRLETTVGVIDIIVRPDWAPHGTRRFLELAHSGDLQELAFYRAIKGCIVQFGLPAKRYWPPLPDDPPTGVPFLLGAVSFAAIGENSRRSTLFICIGDMSHMLGQKSWETPIGAVAESSLDILEHIDTSYGDIAEFGGQGPDTNRINTEGNGYLRMSFPRLSYIRQAYPLDWQPGMDDNGYDNGFEAQTSPGQGQMQQEQSLHKAQTQLGKAEQAMRLAQEAHAQAQAATAAAAAAARAQHVEQAQQASELAQQAAQAAQAAAEAAHQAQMAVAAQSSMSQGQPAVAMTGVSRPITPAGGVQFPAWTGMAEPRDIPVEVVMRGPGRPSMVAHQGGGSYAPPPQPQMVVHGGSYAPPPQMVQPQTPMHPMHMGPPGPGPRIMGPPGPPPGQVIVQHGGPPQVPYNVSHMPPPGHHMGPGGPPMMPMHQGSHPGLPPGVVFMPPGMRPMRPPQGAPMVQGRR